MLLSKKLVHPINLKLWIQVEKHVLNFSVEKCFFCPIKKLYTHLKSKPTRLKMVKHNNGITFYAETLLRIFYLYVMIIVQYTRHHYLVQGAKSTNGAMYVC